MKNNKIILTVFILTLLGTMLIAQSYPLPSLSPYDLAVWTIDGGFIASGTVEPAGIATEGRLYVDVATPTKPIMYRYTSGSWAAVSGGATTFEELQNKPTTLDGYGITDAATEIGLNDHIASHTDPHGAEMTVTESITIGTGSPTAYLENVDGSEIKIVASTTKAMGIVIIYDVSEYADNTAALAGGLAVGTVYRTGDSLKIVH